MQRSHSSRSYAVSDIDGKASHAEPYGCLRPFDIRVEEPSPKLNMLLEDFFDNISEERLNELAFSVLSRKVQSCSAGCSE